MFSVVSLNHLSVCLQGCDHHLDQFKHVLHLGPPPTSSSTCRDPLSPTPWTCLTWTSLYRALNPFRHVQTFSIGTTLDMLSVGNRAVCIRLKCLLVQPVHLGMRVHLTLCLAHCMSSGSIFCLRVKCIE